MIADVFLSSGDCVRLHSGVAHDVGQLGRGAGGRLQRGLRLFKLRPPEDERLRVPQAAVPDWKQQ